MRIGCERFVLELSLMLCATMAAAQPDDTFNQQLEKAISRAAPEWRLDVVPEHMRQPHGYRRWTRGGEHISITYYIRESGDEARDFLRRHIVSLSIPSRQIDGFGNEAYLLAPSSPRGDRTISFRVGRIVVAVKAPNEDAARHFTKLFLPEAVKRNANRPAQ